MKSLALGRSGAYSNPSWSTTTPLNSSCAGGGSERAGQGGVNDCLHRHIVVRVETHGRMVNDPPLPELPLRGLAAKEESRDRRADACTGVPRLRVSKPTCGSAQRPHPPACCPPPLAHLHSAHPRRSVRVARDHGRWQALALEVWILPQVGWTGLVEGPRGAVREATPQCVDVPSSLTRSLPRADPPIWKCPTHCCPQKQQKREAL